MRPLVVHRDGGAQLIAPVDERWGRGVMRDLMVTIRALVDWSNTQRQREKCILKHRNEHTDSKHLQLMEQMFWIFFLYFYTVFQARRRESCPWATVSRRWWSTTRVAVVVQRKYRTRNKHVLVSLSGCHRRRFQLVPRCPINVLTWQFSTFKPRWRINISVISLHITPHHNKPLC